MKKRYASTSIIASLLVMVFFAFGQKSTSKAGSIKEKEEQEFYNVVQKHRQLYSMSCIPSSVEMVLKYNKKVNTSYFEQQDAWKDKSDGSFQNFDGKTIAGITFKHQFNKPRNSSFPLDSLFKTIAQELKAGRKVIISLPSSPSMWHIYVLDRQTADGDFVAYSRGYNDANILEMRHVKELIKEVQGTDILTYSL